MLFPWLVSLAILVGVIPLHSRFGTDQISAGCLSPLR